MNEKSIYFDESGYTGYNLLDPDQPIFSIASSDIENMEAKDILESSFPKYKGSEFKFSSIWRSNSRNLFESFCEKIVNVNSHVWVMDKKFAILTKCVDFLIEPYMTHAGYDFYSDAFAYKLSNYIYYALTNAGDPELYPSLIKQYLKFSRTPNHDTLNNLQITLHLMEKSLEDPPSSLLGMIALGADMFTEFNNIEDFRNSNELYVTSMLSIIAHWRGLYEEDFIAIHDSSAHFLRQKHIWDKLTNSRVPPQMLPTASGEFVKFPLRIKSTQSVNSEDSHSVQFCDIISGIFSKFFVENEREENRALFDRMLVKGLGDITYNGIMAGTEFPDQIPPKRLIGPDVVDQITNIMFGDHNDG